MLSIDKKKPSIHSTKTISIKCISSTIWASYKLLAKLKCTNCNAIIVFEDGSSSNLIELLCGTAQGDSPSPILYNLAPQILVFLLK
jgi:hypothetical protein